ncbi:MAG: mannose-6-phosphate isomerase, partial [Muribaculaceae bacterium]|nr:mannose-6-phosphate isomerase [Muribaculaceae bacterium]
DGTFTDVLATHSSAAGDVFFLPAGRVHAIGAGNLLAEIQESSDITYRIFDYNRRDANGNTRELHTALAKDAIDYKVYENYKTPAPAADVEEANLVACNYFDVKRFKVDGEKQLQFSPVSFTVIMCLEGEMTLHCDSGDYQLKAAHSVLLPATLFAITVTGTATFLTIQA